MKQIAKDIAFRIWSAIVAEGVALAGGFFFGGIAKLFPHGVIQGIFVAIAFFWWLLWSGAAAITLVKDDSKKFRGVSIDSEGKTTFTTFYKD